LNVFCQSNVTVFFLKRDEGFYNKSRLPQFGNSLQCESSGQKRPAKFVKSEMN